MSVPSSQRRLPPARRRRSYLIDARFQLKYTGLLVGVVTLVVLVLGVLLARSSTVASAAAQSAVAQAERAMKESHTSSKLALENTLANGGDDPALVQIMTDTLAATDKQSEKDLQAVRDQRAEIERERMETRVLLLGGGAGLAVLLGLLGVFITSKIVGPVVKLKRLLRRAGTGRLTTKEKLRKGDELEDLFDTFLQMTHSLRALQAGRIATLDTTLVKAQQTGAAPEVLDGLLELRAQMCLGLGESAPESDAAIEIQSSRSLARGGGT